MKHIFIAIPTVDGNVNFELAMQLLTWTHKSKHRVAIHFEPYVKPIDVCRNKINRVFHNLPYDYLMMIDSDVVPPVEALDSMVASMKSRNVVAAACPIVQPNYDTGKLEIKWNGYKLRKDKGFDNYNGTKLEKVDAVGFGCVMLSRGATAASHPLFRIQKDAHGMIEYGEDMYASINLQARGFDIWMDYRLRCKHMKCCDLSNL